MKTKILFLILAVIVLSCSNQDEEKNHSESHLRIEQGAHRAFHISQEEFEILGIRLDTLGRHILGDYVETSGTLEVPPQNEAAVTAIIGANITDIQVIEGDVISKGEVLTYMTHPNLISLQTAFVRASSDLEYLEQEFQRQESLYAEKIGSGKELQKIKSEYLSKKGEQAGLRAQLKMLGIKEGDVLDGKLFDRIAIRSPISGSVRSVEIKTGQFVQPETTMFEIVDSDHLHADFMVFEKDVAKIKEGQRILFSTNVEGGETMEARIYTIGKAFDEQPRAVHLHAEITKSKGFLLPGMYVRGKIITEEEESYALPNEALADGEDSKVFFTASLEDEGYKIELHQVKTGRTDGLFTEVSVSRDLEKALILQNQAYYVLAEMNKAEMEHSH